MIQYLQSLLGSIYQSMPVEAVDNAYGGVDIVGSWVEFGLVAVAVVAGVFFSLPVLFKAIDGWKSRNKYKKITLPTNYWKHHSAMHETLTELRVELDAARVSIVQFHNGGNFFDGTPMTKLTMSHESLRNGIAQEAPNWRELQMPLMIPLLERVQNDSPELYITSEDNDSYAQQQLNAGNVLAYTVLPLYKSNAFVGFVMCHWCAWNKVDDIVEDKARNKMNDARDRLQIELERESRRNG